MLPLAQLYVRDVPDLHAPAGADLLQVLWCPFDHPIMPRTALLWRSAATVTGILTTAPEPPAVQFDSYLPEPCLLNPEQVTEYPNPMELSKELRERLGDWNTWQAADAAMDSSSAPHPEEFYKNELSVAPGWKVGGWASWGPTDPVPQFCPACDTKMDPLLTIATFEWDDSNRSWIPDEDCADQARARASSRQTRPEAQAVIDFFRAKDIEVHDRGRVPLEARATPPVTDSVPRQPTAVQIGSGYIQQLYVCPTSPKHPHTELMQ
ncbi:non-ribosomal peptide synthetase [Streptomyces sp. NPDC048527]|uniref:non-ribosomal peptide synthetase n=1 Tax=Streptomyces sp. NPDC048527 TaxID=3365568 RepID=UPI00371154C5